MKQKGMMKICLMVIMLFVLCGCSVKEKQGKKENEAVYTLNERQKSILEKKGLSTEYEDLTYSQQQAIVSIEELLQVLETKYGEEFSYESYTEKSILENEYLIAYPSRGEHAGVLVMIEKRIIEDEVIYVDDYMDFQIREPMNEYVREFVKKELQTDEIKVYSEVKTTLEAMPNDFSELKGNVTGDVMIFVDSRSVTEKAIDNFISNCKEWMKRQEFYGLTQIILLKEEKFSLVTGYNYADYVREEHHVRRELVWINE